LDAELEARLRQARRSSDPSSATTPSSSSPTRKISAPLTERSPSKIPVAQDYLSSSSSNNSSTRNSPARHVLTNAGFSQSAGPVAMAQEEDAALGESPPSKQQIESRIPLPKSSRASPPKQQPTFGFSFSPERLLKEAKQAAEGELENRAVTSAPPMVGPKPAGQKRFEAFVMTGDRMINLARTPANAEFKSKYYKTSSDSCILPDGMAKGQHGLLLDPVADLAEETQEEAGMAVHRRAVPPARRAIVRTSKSEDQLNMDTPPMSPQEDCSGSVNTLMDTSGVAALPVEDKGEGDPHACRRKSDDSQEEVEDANMSEHYDAESMLKISPERSSSSPDTPEWSLLDSFHKGSSKQANVTEDALMDISNCGHKVVISIGDNQKANGSGDEANEESKPASDSGSNGPSFSTKTFTRRSSSPTKASRAADYTPESAKTTKLSVESSGHTGGHAGGGHSSEEESDMDSLHSYHPPVKVVDIPSAVRLAKRLYNLQGFKKTDVSRHLSKNTDYNHVVAEEYLRFFDFQSMALDEAVRSFLARFCLTGETQERERVLLHFARRYLECNPGQRNQRMFGSADAVHTPTCAIMLLNTDLHGEMAGGGAAVRRKMTCAEFVENLSELNDGGDFPRDLLRAVYSGIRERPIPWSEDEANEAAAAGASVGPLPHSPPAIPAPVAPQLPESSSVAIGRSAGGVNPFLSLPDANRAVLRHASYVMRKCCHDANGKRTKLGKRSWKMFFVALRDMVLYCFKDEKSARSPAAFADSSAAIRIHHALAARAGDYTKKQFVFRLHTADRAEYLFQASDERELLTWIDAVNFAAAGMSAPQLAAPCAGGGAAAARRFQRPLLPSAETPLAPIDQLAEHERQLEQLRSDAWALEEDRASGSSSAATPASKEKAEFLKFEIMRYETYVLTLKTKAVSTGSC